MTRVVEDSTQVETWRSAVRGKIFVKTFDRKGELRSTLVKPGGVIHLTPNERRLNTENAASEDLDVFQNGHLVPVRLIEGDEDVKAIQDNPNHISEDDMRELLADARARKKFDAAVEGIDNPITLERFLAVAEECDATHRQMNVIKDRLRTVSDQTGVVEIETVGDVGSGVDS